MLLLLHVTIAFSAVFISLFGFFMPSKYKLKISYWLAGATFISGAVLAIANPATLMRVCAMGLIYFAVMGALIAFTKRRLVKAAEASL